MKIDLLYFYKEYSQFWIAQSLLVYLPLLIMVQHFLKRFGWRNCLAKQYLPEQLLVLIAVLGIFPNLILKLPGGAGNYFSMAQYFPMIALCIGMGIPQDIYRNISGKKYPLVPIAFLILFFSFAVRNCHFKIFREVGQQRMLASQQRNVDINTEEGHQAWKEMSSRLKSIRKNDGVFAMVNTYFKLLASPAKILDDAVLRQLDGLNQVTVGKKQDYIVWLRPDFYFFQLPMRPLSEIFVVPAYTGLAVISPIYAKGKYLYMQTEKNTVLRRKSKPLFYGLDREDIRNGKIL